MDASRRGVDRQDQAAVPPRPEEPGIYRLTFRPTSGADLVYIGEANQLRRRFTGYRTPGSKQPTNQRINAVMQWVIDNGGTVELETATQIRVDIDGREVVTDLAHRPYRLLAENAALVVARDAGQVILNQ